MSDVRHIITLRDDWRFARIDAPAAAQLDYDDSQWSQIRVPHDWAIEGAFDKAHDLMVTKIVEDGQTKAWEHSGRTGGLPHVGVGWYRRGFSLSRAEAESRVFVEFGGVMSHSRVHINGHEIGSWPYGYSSFCFELTDHIRWDEENMLAVRVDNKPQASRWYPGAGIYRHVRLVVVNPVHVTHWGTYITTPEITAREALVAVSTEIANQTDCKQKVELTARVIDPSGAKVIKGTLCQDIEAGATRHFDQELEVTNPILWDIADPQLYNLVTEVRIDGRKVDHYETPFGIRALRFDANEGFFLNDRRVQLKGVCMHHDLGALGAAVNRRALERQLEILQEMGCNAIRTSHNPPAPELLDLCDRMGFLVIDEAFDEWRQPKMKNGYHILFDDWAEKDLRAMIKRDRNHPCVIMWSIGNEIPDQNDPRGAEVARFLTGICHDEDPTRPVTAGFNLSDQAIAHGLAAAVDIPGWNYKCHLYEKYHAEHPEWVMYGAETESCISSRGEYFLPVEIERGITRPSLHCTSYDVAAPPWGYEPDREFAAQEDYPFSLGQFTWTGFDYLGEPTPYYTQWPSRSSYFGIVDLCGLPKDRYYLYRSHWSDKPTLHLLPHWNWEGCEGQSIPVHCYTSYPSAELFLNGQSLGVRKKGAQESSLGLPYTRYRLIWEDVPYEPGTLKVVAFDEQNRPAMVREMRTAGAPARIELLPDRSLIKADGQDLSFITVRITDSDGNLCPRAENRVAFKVTGTGEITAVDNGDPTSLEPFGTGSRRTFNGMCVLILRSLPGKKGPMRIKAAADGLAPAEVVVIAH